MITIRKATERDVHALVARMRDQDAAEVYAVSGPFTAHDLWQKMNDAHVALDDKGHVICLFGCSPIAGHDDHAAPWMLGTNRLDRHILSMCRQARHYVDMWLEQYPVLTNATLVHNTVVIAWLKWLGFQFTDTFTGPFDPDSTFIQFYKVRPCANP